MSCDALYAKVCVYMKFKSELSCIDIEWLLGEPEMSCDGLYAKVCVYMKLKAKGNGGREDM